MSGMNEKQQAIELANRVLDKPYIDPDGDICLLARQFLRAVEREDSGNYVCDDEAFPTEATFSNGRVVKIVGETTGKPYLMISPKSEYPKPCGICAGVIQSKDDLDWHGYGNCRDIPDTIMKKM